MTAQDSQGSSTNGAAPVGTVSRRNRWLLILIVVVGAALRLYGLGSRSIWYDEGATLMLADYCNESFALLLSPEASMEPPMLPALLSFWQGAVAGVPGVAAGSAFYDFLLRLLPCLFSIVAIPLAYLCAWAMLRDMSAALLAAFLVAISPLEVFYAQELRSYSLYVLVSLGAFWFMLRALDKDRLRDWLGLTLCLSLGIYTHFFFVWNMAAFGVYVVLTFRGRWRLLGKWAAAQAATLLLSAPALLLAFRLERTLAGVDVQWTPPPDLRTPFITFKNFFAGYSPNSYVYWALFLVAGIAFGMGIVRLRKSWNTLVLALSVAVLPIVANAAIWHLRGFSLYEHRLFIFSGVVCSFVVAAGLRTLNRATMAAVVILMTVLTIPCLADHYAQRIHPMPEHRLGVRHHLSSREAAAHIRERLTADTFVGHVSHFTVPSFRHYLPDQRQNALRLTQAELDGFLLAFPAREMCERAQTLPVPVVETVGQARDLWLVESWWEPGPVPLHVARLRGWFDAHFLGMSRRLFDGLKVYSYLNVPDVRLRTLPNRLCDSGDWTWTHYRFDPRDRAIALEWYTRFLDAAPSTEDQKPDQIGLRFDVFLDESRAGENPLPAPNETLPRFSASFPSYATGEFSYRFVVTNSSDTQRIVQCRVYVSTAIVEPLAFTRTEPDSPIWQAVPQQQVDWTHGAVDTFAMAAELTGDTQDDTGIYADLLLPTGSYTVWARTLETVNQENVGAGSIQVAAGSPGQTERNVIGTVSGNDPSGVAGWSWRLVGTLASDGEPVRLTVTAHKHDRLPTAKFGLGRLLFAPRDAGSSLALEHSSSLNLAPGAEVNVDLSSSMEGHARKRVDVEIYDPQTRQQRNVFFHVLDPKRTVEASAAANAYEEEENEDLTPEQREQIELLEQIGYLSGSNPATELENVTIYDAQAAYNGFSLVVSGHAPEALLIDMHGSVLHSWQRTFHEVWPERPTPEEGHGHLNWRRAYVFENGDLLAIYEGLGLIKLDKDSNLIWSFDEHAHHDLEVLPNGDIYVLTRKAHILEDFRPETPVLEDFITLLDRDGHVKHRTSLLRALEKSEFSGVVDAFKRGEFRHEVDARMWAMGDLFHTNTLEYLDGALAHVSPLFKRGNILTSFKTTHALAIVDPDTETVVWYSTGPWTGQHQPTLLPNAHMLLFDNNRFSDHSKVIEFEPFSGDVVWSFSGTPPASFFTEACGSSQPLPNGNVLITESEDGRAFEVNRDGTIVWEYFNPHRVGDSQDQVAYLFEVVRLPPDFPLDWADVQPGPTP